jgi:hypothetical protein
MRALWYAQGLVAGTVFVLGLAQVNKFGGPAYWDKLGAALALIGCAWAVLGIILAAYLDVRGTRPRDDDGMDASISSAPGRRDQS